MKPLLKKDGATYENIYGYPSLVKMYHREADTAALERLFSTFKITHIFLSEISKIEFTSTIWKKVRTKEIIILMQTLKLQVNRPYNCRLF